MTKKGKGMKTFECFFCGQPVKAKEVLLVKQQDEKHPLCPCYIQLLEDYEKRLQSDPNSISGRRYRDSGNKKDMALGLLIFETKMYRKMKAAS